MAWSTNKTWSPGEDLTASLMNQYVRDQLDETAPAIATAAGRLIVTDGVNSIVERLPSPGYIATAETTSSASFVDLPSLGPQVTVTTGTLVLIAISVRCSNSVSGGGAIAGVNISGATTASAATTEAYWATSSAANDDYQGSYVYLRAVTAGSNTFKLKYAAPSAVGIATFRDRRLAVIPF
jgi:hypothetical protein